MAVASGRRRRGRGYGRRRPTLRRRGAKNNHVAAYTERLRDRFKVDGDVDDEGFILDFLDCFEHACESESHCSYYGTDSDEPLIDAARALRLPSWAHLSLDDGGSVGNAYSQPVVVLDRPYVGDDLRTQMSVD